MMIQKKKKKVSLESEKQLRAETLNEKNHEMDSFLQQS